MAWPQPNVLEGLIPSLQELDSNQEGSFLLTTQPMRQQLEKDEYKEDSELGREGDSSLLLECIHKQSEKDWEKVREEKRNALKCTKGRVTKLTPIKPETENPKQRRENCAADFLPVPQAHCQATMGSAMLPTMSDFPQAQSFLQCPSSTCAAPRVNSLMGGPQRNSQDRHQSALVQSELLRAEGQRRVQIMCMGTTNLQHVTHIQSPLRQVSITTTLLVRIREVKPGTSHGTNRCRGQLGINLGLSPLYPLFPRKTQWERWPNCSARWMKTNNAQKILASPGMPREHIFLETELRIRLIWLAFCIWTRCCRDILYSFLFLTPTI